MSVGRQFVFFQDMHSDALLKDKFVIHYTCISKESRAVTWRAWKDWFGGTVPDNNGPIHDNKNFVTRYGNGSKVAFMIPDRSL